MASPKKRAKKTAAKPMTARRAARKVAGTKRPAATSTGLPRVPPEWTTDTSAEHWMPDPALRAEIAELTRSTIKQTPAEATKTWAKVERRLPAPLRKVIPRSPWRWGNVASPAIAEVAMKLLAHAASRDGVTDAAIVESELERILPDGPSLCLIDVVGSKAYGKAVAAVEARWHSRSDALTKALLGSLVTYLTST